MIRPSRIVFLVAVWVLLWGDLSLANVLSGVAVSVLLLVLVNPDRGPRRAGRRRLSAWGILRLCTYLSVQLIVSNALVLREILRRRARVRTAVVACALRVPSESVMTFVANVLSLSPGTIPIEQRRDPPCIVLHVLNLHDAAELRANVAKLERLAVEAFGSPEERAALVAPAPAEVAA